MRVAALPDVHGNAPALAAVLQEVERETPDLVVFCGDLTWGSLPRETLALVRAIETPTRFVRGNADRAVLELARSELQEPSARERWMLEQHGEEDIAFLDGFERIVSVELDGLGPVCFCHGSPRSDEECVTERTPPERVNEFMADRGERVVVTAHVHVQYDRTVNGLRCVGPGSVGLPYEGATGAFWALLDGGVELQRSDYDVEASLEVLAATGFPAFDDVFPKALRGLVSAESASAEFERRRGA